MKGKTNVKYSFPEKNNLMKKECNLEVEFNLVPSASPLKREDMLALIGQMKKLKKDQVSRSNNPTFESTAKDTLGNVLTYMIDSINVTKLSIKQNFEKRKERSSTDELAEIREKIANEKKDSYKNSNASITEGMSGETQDKNSLVYVSKYEKFTDEEKQKILGEIAENSAHRIDNYRTIIDSMKGFMNLNFFTIAKNEQSADKNFNTQSAEPINTMIPTGIDTEENPPVNNNFNNEVRTTFILEEYVPGSPESKEKVARKPEGNQGKDKDTSGDSKKNLIAKPVKIPKGSGGKTSSSRMSPGPAKNPNRIVGKEIIVIEETKVLEVNKRTREIIKIADSPNAVASSENVSESQNLFNFKIPQNQQVADIQKSIVHSSITKSIPVKVNPSENTAKEGTVSNINPRTSIPTSNTQNTGTERLTEQITGNLTIQSDRQLGKQELITEVVKSQPQGYSQSKPSDMEFESQSLKGDESNQPDFTKNKKLWESHLKDCSTFSNYDEVVEANKPREMIINTKLSGSNHKELRKENDGLNFENLSKAKRGVIKKRPNAAMLMSLETAELYEESRHPQGQCMDTCCPCKAAQQNCGIY